MTAAMRMLKAAVTAATESRKIAAMADRANISADDYVNAYYRLHGALASLERYAEWAIEETEAAEAAEKAVEA